MNATSDTAVPAVSALLYLFDPDGMGASAFALEDEYDDPARRLVAQARDSGDLGELIRAHYASSTDHPKRIQDETDLLVAVEKVLSGS